MEPVFKRRSALRGAAVLAAGAAVPVGTAAAGEFPELTWRATGPGASPPPFRMRIISGIPAAAGYGTVVTLGPVIVQVISDRVFPLMLRDVGYSSLTATVTGAVVVTDARGLSGRLPVTVEFPRVTMPAIAIETVLTGTATLTGAPQLPAVRNPGTMTIKVEPSATGAVTVFKDSGVSRSFTSTITLFPPNGNPLVATVEVR
ncbi:hypothetical protein SAMN05421837_108368 [Amycolatopsis pretoriensis]|uniref:Uncharacterized protein n=1 Tax=Amycolatopsis pretoriensis TaxID=218821 RepID=A0A1H5RBK3_9PSEU|nr:hypothetical protein [Amycolatopsis pretoriensis]SEF35773.1 hypothetical protein SAMN05421837_108368 [Amycolatopsis pretoriensis]